MFKSKRMQIMVDIEKSRALRTQRIIFAALYERHAHPKKTTKRNVVFIAPDEKCQTAEAVIILHACPHHFGAVLLLLWLAVLHCVRFFVF